MSLLIGWLVRGAVRSIIRSMTVKPAPYEAYAAVTPGVLEVKLSTGGEQSLAFEQMFRLDKERVWANDDGDMFAALEAGWPQQVDGRPIHDWGDGMTLCDMTTVLREQPYAIGLLQYGQIKRWWQLQYDPNVRCLHADVGACQEYCTVMVTNLHRSTSGRRRKRQRKPLSSRFSLPDLLPGRGVAIA